MFSTIDAVLNSSDYYLPIDVSNITEVYTVMLMVGALLKKTLVVKN